MNKIILLVVLGGMIHNLIAHATQNSEELIFGKDNQHARMTSRKKKDLLHPVEELYPWIHHIKIKRRKSAKKNRGAYA